VGILGEGGGLVIWVLCVLGVKHVLEGDHNRRYEMCPCVQWVGLEVGMVQR
jgi:hypothetical protein